MIGGIFGGLRENGSDKSSSVWNSHRRGTLVPSVLTPPLLCRKSRASFSRGVLWGYLPVRFFGLVERQPGAIVVFLPLVRRKLHRPLLRLYRCVEIAGLGLCRGEGVKNDGVFPVGQLASVGRELDGLLAVTELCFGANGHDHRAGVVRIRVAGREPYGRSELGLGRLEVPEAGEDEAQVIMCLDVSGMEPCGCREMTLRLGIPSLVGKDRPQAVVDIGVARIEPKRLGEMSHGRLVLTLGVEDDAQILVGIDGARFKPCSFGVMNLRRLVAPLFLEGDSQVVVGTGESGIEPHAPR